MTCDRCYLNAAIGSHGEGVCPYQPRRSTAVHPDTVIGGFWAENGFPEKTWFPSHSAHRAALAATGKQIGAKWVPGDRYLKRWDAPSEKTLRDAAVLLSRGIEARQSRQQQKAARAREFPIEVTPCT